MKKEDVGAMLALEIKNPNATESCEIKNFIDSLLIKQIQMKKDYSKDEVMKMWRRWRAERL